MKHAITGRGGGERAAPTFLESAVRPSSSEDAMIQPARTSFAPLLPLPFRTKKLGRFPCCLAILSILNKLTTSLPGVSPKKDTDTDAYFELSPIHAARQASASSAGLARSRTDSRCLTRARTAAGRAVLGGPKSDLRLQEGTRSRLLIFT